uniref:Uncharacterized protein n=1 Tax=Mustela putorius furo TaxID=9669 RepID=M3YYX4_MUSPF
SCPEVPPPPRCGAALGASARSSANVPFRPLLSLFQHFSPVSCISPGGRVAPSHSQRLQKPSPDTRLCWRRNSAKVSRQEKKTFFFFFFF